MADQKGWNFGGILKQIEESKAAPPKRLCVLLSTGALSPVHKGHVRMMDQARHYLESKQGYRTLGGFLSASHDLYVGPKARAKGVHFVPASQRLEMIRLSLSDCDFLESGTWEAAQHGRWPDFPEVVSSLDSSLQDAFPHLNITVFYVCGADHGRYCSRGFGQPRQGVVVIPRDQKCSVTEHDSQLVFVAPPVPETDGYSSTLVRTKLQRKDYKAVTEMVGEPVMKYIFEQGLFGVKKPSPLSS